MSNVERTTSWQQIQQGVKEAERLIARKEYNLVMVRARQVLEYMVRCMAERACVVEGDLSDTIDQLYEGQWINKATKDNYHTIRILGNKAVHEGDDTAYDANQAFQLLTQEVYVFANEFAGGSGGRPVRTSSGCKEYIRAPGAQAGNRRRQERFRQEQPEGTCQEYTQRPVPPGRSQKEAQTGISGSIHIETADSGAACYTSDCGYPCFYIGQGQGCR